MADQHLADVARQGKAFAGFPGAVGQLINFVGFVPPDAEMKESGSAPGDPEVLRAEFAGWDPRIEDAARSGAKHIPLGAV